MRQVCSFARGLLPTRGSYCKLSQKANYSCAANPQSNKATNFGVATALFRRLRGADSDRLAAVLLVKRGKEPNLGLWALPGGRLRDDESLFDGAVRELQEETGVSAANFDLLPEPVNDVLVQVKGVVWGKLYVFAGIETEPSDPKALDDAAEAAFWTTGELKRLPTVDGLEATVQKALQAVQEKLETARS